MTTQNHPTRPQGGVCPQAGNGGKASAPLILFIDDDDDLVSALSDALVGAGYRTRRASNGDQGIRLAQQERPDLILLDWMMPVKSGFEACVELRRIPSLNDVPIIVLTAFGQNIGEVYGLSSGGKRALDDFMEKPFEPNILFERVAGLLRV